MLQNMGEGVRGTNRYRIAGCVFKAALSYSGIAQSAGLKLGELCPITGPFKWNH